MTDATTLDLLLLAVVGLVAGAVNTVAGAGSLLLLPALLWTGLPADAANATNRIGILAQTSMAVVGFHRQGHRIDRAEVRMVGLVMVGGIVGSFIATRLDADAMELVILIAMAGMLAVSLWPRAAVDAKDASSRAGRPSPTSITPPLALGLLCVGVYGGFLQAGVGILLILFLERTTSMDLVRANVLKSYATLALTVCAITVFASAGERLDLARGGALAAGSALGGLFGARATVHLGPAFVRRAVTIAITVALLKMLWDRFGS